MEESLYEDVQYLDDDVEYMDCIDECNELDSKPELASANDNVSDNFIDESETVRLVSAHSYLFEVFLLLVLCFLFLVKLLTKCITTSNVLKKKMDNLDKKVKQLQSDNLNLRNSVKCSSSKFNTVSTNLQNLEKSVAHIFNWDQLNILKKI